MHDSKPRTHQLVWGIALLALLAIPAFAEDMIHGGADLWPTAQGSSFTSFAEDPIPAGFFCPGSRLFDGEIAMNGKPLVTDPPGVLGKVDTIVHRLDDVTFDDDGVATTRLRLMALSMVGTEPIDVGCETPFEVTASLDGEQPMTEMRIVREGEWGGTYAAPLSLNVKMVFTPVGGGESRQVNREIHLGPAPGSYWTTTDRVGTDAWGDPVRVDTTGDCVADSALPGPSNFVAGMMSPTSTASGCGDGFCSDFCCHCKPEDSEEAPTWSQKGNNCAPDHLHCVICCKPCEILPVEESING